MNRTSVIAAVLAALVLASAAPSAAAAPQGTPPKTASETAPPPAINLPSNAVPGATPPQPPPPEPVVLTPLVFTPELPAEPVAWVEGKPVPQSDLLRLVLEQNFSTGIAAMMMTKILEIELQRTEMTISDEEIDQEMEDLVNNIAPGKTVEEVVTSGHTSAKHLRSQARTNRGWKKLFWQAHKIPEDQRANPTNQMLMQFFIHQTMTRYDRKIRGQNPAPVAGLVAQVVEKETGNEINIGASEALDFLMGLVKQSGLIEARDEVVERAILDQAMAAKEVEVTEQEVADWAAQMRVKYPPPFNWEQICRFKGTTPEREMERWRRIQAWKRITATEPSEEDIQKFLDEHKDFFLGKTKKVSHILIRTTDEITGQELSPEEQAAAREQIEQIHAKLLEGVDFGWMAENYSEDAVTARGKGKLAQPIKEWGGGLDTDFQNAAWTLDTAGELSEPIKSRYGWHVIKLDEISVPPARQEPNWREPRYWEWVQDEYETLQMTRFVKELKAKADVKLVPDEQILELKERSYWTPAEKD